MNVESSSKPNILIVDDTPENLQLLTSMLQQQGYTVRPVPSGQLALQSVKVLPPDLILLDINMPHMNGYDVCEELKANDTTKDIPVIFISALNQTMSLIKAFNAGGVDYVTKPFQFEEIRVRVETHLALQNLRLELEAKNQRLEQSLTYQRKLEQTKAHLIQMIVHDLKNPLSALMGYSYLLREKSMNSAMGAKTIEDIAIITNTMHRMVLNILDVMQLEDHKLQIRPKLVDLVTLATAAIKTISPIAHKSDHVIEIKAPANVPKLPLDSDLMQRVLENLLENSIKYAPNNTSIVVAIEKAKGGEILIKIHDQGPGVPEDQRDQVFEMYSRLERDEQLDTRQSRGLGLAFCKMVVESHNGRIWIEDDKPQGSFFCISIPNPPPS